jgi:hypothetical protein
MISLKTIRSSIHTLGYDLVWASLTADLAYCLSMREVHSRDAIEIEELYRQFVLPDLPRREGRADLLNELIGDVHYLCNHEAMRFPDDICEFGVAGRNVAPPGR